LLERLFIEPVFTVASSGSARSPRHDERLDLKIQTIEYYGLWASTEQDEKLRQVFTMLPGSDEEAAAPAAVPFSEAILAHIWPSGKARGSLAVGQLLGLPEGFHVTPRNFLILRKGAEQAFDADALLLFPCRGRDDAAPAAATARSRLFKVARMGAVKQQEAAAAFAGRQLYLPRAHDGHVPFMRLLAWKAVSALRASEEDADAQADLPVELDLNASQDDSAAAKRAVSRMCNAEFRFVKLL
jgi:hypothetical protein